MLEGSMQRLEKPDPHIMIIFVCFCLRSVVYLYQRISEVYSNNL